MFDQLSDKLLETIRNLRNSGKLSEANIDQALRQVRLNLLEADVHYQVVKEFIDGIRQKAVGKEVLESLTPGQAVVKIIHDELCRLLGEKNTPLNLSTKPPVVLLMVGLQGSGKTTTSAKLAHHLKGRGRHPFLVPADVTRPAAIEQLKILAQKIAVPCFDTKPNDNPVKVCERSLKEAIACSCDTVILDSAGRLHIDDSLMKELKKIVKSTNPQEILLVADAMTGQDAINIAKSFDQELNLSGVILSKMDGQARAGAALSMKMVTGKPIKFVGTGEGVQALELFHPERVASRILDMGDIVSLAEKAQKVFDEKHAEDLLHKMRKNEFTLVDFLKQLKMMKKMGSMESLLGMLPGFKKMKGNVDFQEAEKDLKHKEAIVFSMTLKERMNHHILNASRRKRIALGSGTRVQDVNKFMREFSQMQKMMNKLGKKGLKGMASLMGGFPNR